MTYGGIPIRYIGVVLFMIVFVVLYVWQNIEVMKMKMEYRRELRAERQLADRNDRLWCEIEKFRRMELIERYAASKGMREISPADFEVIDIRKAK